VTRVLVTGATGFIGRHTLEPLIGLGLEVHALSSREAPADPASGVRWHRGDLLAPEGAAPVIEAVRPDVLLHLAWYVEHGSFWDSPENLRWVEASSRLLRAFADGGGTRAVLAGTCAEYDWSIAGRCVENSTPTNPHTLYGAAKHALHVLAAAYARQAGVGLAWGRLFFLLGPGEHPNRLVPSVARDLLAGRRAAVGSGSNVRDFLAVADAGDAFAALVDSEITGPVNIGSGDPVVTRDLILAVGEAAGRPDLIDFGARPEREDEPCELVASVRRLREELAWSPRMDFRAAVRAAVDAWR